MTNPEPRGPPDNRARGSSHAWDPADRPSPTLSRIHPTEGPVTTTLAPEPKTTTPTSSPLPATWPTSSPPRGSRPVRMRGGSPLRAPGPGRPAGTARRARHQALQRRPEASPRSSRSTTSRSAWSAATIHGILGANGSGKSTLIRLVSGLLTLDTGKVEVFGLDIERDELAVKRLINRVSRRRGVLQEAQPDGEPPVRGPPLWPGRRGGAAAGEGDPRPAGHRGEPPRPARSSR